MEITVTMPELAPDTAPMRLLSYGKCEKARLELGDRLFSYEADGALMHEYSPHRGHIELLIARVGEYIESGQAVMLVEAEEMSASLPLFGQSEEDDAEPDDPLRLENRARR